MSRDSTQCRQTRAVTDADLSRRSFVERSAAVAAGALPSLGPATPDSAPLKVVCVGGHPDDPESGCGGTLARYAESGHHVTIIYLTRGQAGIRGESAGQAASIRTAEAEAACKIIGAKPVFATQVDGATEINRDRT